MGPLQIAEGLKEMFQDKVLEVEEFRGQFSVTIKK